jgi:hypothetical protein
MKIFRLLISKEKEISILVVIGAVTAEKKEIYNIEQGNTENNLTTTDDTEQEDCKFEFFWRMQLEKNTDVNCWTNEQLDEALMKQEEEFNDLKNRIKEFHCFSVYLQVEAINRRMHIERLYQLIGEISTDVNEQENPFLQVFY